MQILTAENYFGMNLFSYACLTFAIHGEDLFIKYLINVLETTAKALFFVSKEDLQKIIALPKDTELRNTFRELNIVNSITNIIENYHFKNDDLKSIVKSELDSLGKEG